MLGFRPAKFADRKTSREPAQVRRVRARRRPRFPNSRFRSQQLSRFGDRSERIEIFKAPQSCGSSMVCDARAPAGLIASGLKRLSCQISRAKNSTNRSLVMLLRRDAWQMLASSSGSKISGQRG